MTFFGQKHGLTPGEKGGFMDFGKIWSRKDFFSFESQKAFFLGLFYAREVVFYAKSESIFSRLILINLNKETIGIFWPKAWINPLEKGRFYGL